MNDIVYKPKIVQFPLPERVALTDSDWKDGLLIRSTNWLGDALMTLPAVYQLKRLMPAGKKLAVLCPKNLAPMWGACPFVDAVVAMESKRISREEIRQVKALNLGVAMVFPNSYGSASDIRHTRIPIRLGRRGRWRAWQLTHTLREWPRGEGTGVCHQLSYYLELVGLVGTPEYTVECPSLCVDSALAAALGVPTDKPILAIAPGAAYGPAKQWPAASFVNVAQAAEVRGQRVVLVGGFAECAVCEAISAQLQNPLNLAGKTDLAQLMSVLSAATVVLANDSGAMHLAAALGKRGIGIFGSTDPVATGPIGGTWRLLVAQTPCRPCFQRTCPHSGQDAYRCLKSITPDTVIDALASFE